MKTRCLNLRDHEVRGLLDGSITALWRPVKEPAQSWLGYNPRPIVQGHLIRDYAGEEILYKCPFGKPGDVLIGREAWRQLYAGGAALGGRPVYRADIGRDGNADKVENSLSWWSAAQMPGALSRIRRELVAVECIQGKDRPIDGSISAWEAERETWFWKLTVREVAK